MLSDEEKEKIKEEEIYRDEVRKSFQTPKTQLQKILFFFNSSLGNWILTSILVGIVSFSFNYFHDKSDRQREKEERIEKIDMEIQSRIYQYNSLLGNIEKILNEPVDSSDKFGGMTRLGSSRLMQYLSQTGLYDIWIRFKNGEQFEMLSIQVPEYTNRPISSLIADIIPLLEDKMEVQRLSSVREYIMADSMFEGKKARNMAIEINEVKRLQNIIKNKLLINRWKFAE